MKIIFTFCHDSECGETTFSGNVRVADALRLLTSIVLTSFEEELEKINLGNDNNQENQEEGLDK